MHLVDDEVGDAQVPVDDPVCLEVVVVFAERIDQRFRHLASIIAINFLQGCWPFWSDEYNNVQKAAILIDLSNIDNFFL